MRIAVLSDIHGNLPALEAVHDDIKKRSVDQIWCGGDIAWGGPWAKECIAFVREAGWPSVKGNTDVWITGDPQAVPDPKDQEQLRDIAAAHAISPQDATWLLNQPIGHHGPGGLLLVHASPKSPFDAPGPDSPIAAFEQYQSESSVVVYGHVHHAFLRRLTDGTLVCNSGSVGLPKDGPTAVYLLIDQKGPNLGFEWPRVEFDRDLVVKAAEAADDAAAAWFLEKFQG